MTERTNPSTDTTHCHYGSAGNLLGEIGTYHCAWLDRIPLAVIDLKAGSNPTITHIHSDHLSAPRLASNSDGQIIWRWDSDAFGNTPPNQDPDGDGNEFELNLRFPGQYYNQETGLHYNLNRYYDPSTGRYIESDPIGLKGGFNTYAYAGDNPVNFVDPKGEIKLHGSWCGPDWTGGFQKSYDQLDATE